MQYCEEWLQCKPEIFGSSNAHRPQKDAFCCHYIMKSPRHLFLCFYISQQFIPDAQWLFNASNRDTGGTMGTRSFSTESRLKTKQTTTRQKTKLKNHWKLWHSGRTLPRRREAWVSITIKINGPIGEENHKTLNAIPKMGWHTDCLQRACLCILKYRKYTFQSMQAVYPENISIRTGHIFIFFSKKLHQPFFKKQNGFIIRQYREAKASSYSLLPPSGRFL